jgi:hypothetical protein
LSEGSPALSLIIALTVHFTSHLFYDVQGYSRKKIIIFNFSIAATFSLVSGELVVADISELYINGIIGECHTLRYTRQWSAPTPSSSRPSDRKYPGWEM